jgi:hypothetical protein
MLPKFCLDDNVRSAFRSPGEGSVLGKMKIAKRTREAKLREYPLITASLTTIRSIHRANHALMTSR